VPAAAIPLGGRIPSSRAIATRGVDAAAGYACFSLANVNAVSLFSRRGPPLDDCALDTNRLLSQSMSCQRAREQFPAPHASLRCEPHQRAERVLLKAVD